MTLRDSGRTADPSWLPLAPAGNRSVRRQRQFELGEGAALRNPQYVSESQIVTCRPQHTAGHGNSSRAKAGQPTAGNTRIDPTSLPAYQAVAEYLMRK